MSKPAQKNSLVHNDSNDLLWRLTIMSVAPTKNHAFLLRIIVKLCRALHGIQQTMGNRNSRPVPFGMPWTGEEKYMFLCIYFKLAINNQLTHNKTNHQCCCRAHNAVQNTQRQNRFTRAWGVDRNALHQEHHPAEHRCANGHQQSVLIVQLKERYAVQRLFDVAGAEFNLQDALFWMEFGLRKLYNIDTVPLFRIVHLLWTSRSVVQRWTQFENSMVQSQPKNG